MYRKVNGNEAVVLGLQTAAQLAKKQLVYSSYPITPASEILHGLAELKHFGTVTFQAEDEICAMGSTIGAAFGGALAVTGTSGPGLALKSEAINLAVMVELPMVIVDVQRGGPSTGLPTKTEQSDLLQAMYGRNGESPIPVIAAASPSDCFAAAIEACRVAIKYMTPVMLMTDGFIGNSSEPWRVVKVEDLEPIECTHPTGGPGETFKPYVRNADLARPWALPGTPGCEHRVGGLEKADGIGCVSHDPKNHEIMTKLRDAKVAGIQPMGEPYIWTGERTGDVLIIGWGGTHGAIKAATLEMQQEGLYVSACHLRYLNPLPADLPDRLSRFSEVIVAELNLGQLAMILRSKYLLNVKSLTKVRGQPFAVSEIIRGVKRILARDNRILPLRVPSIGVTEVAHDWVQSIPAPQRLSYVIDDEE
jgi:2-oxoglutarate ferredoxin oxidoreductase subunit alpha